MRVTWEDIENKDRARADRILRSTAARRRRKTTKNIRETLLTNRWAKARKARKNGKKANEMD